jgi:hypothetical protein
MIALRLIAAVIALLKFLRRRSASFSGFSPSSARSAVLA